MNRSPSRASVLSTPSGSLSRGSRSGFNMDYADLSETIKGILNKKKREITESQDKELDKRTIIHYGGSSIKLQDLYGLVLSNTEVLDLILPMIDSIIKKLIDCIKEETTGNH